MLLFSAFEMLQLPEFNGVEAYYFFICGSAHRWVGRWKGLSSSTKVVQGWQKWHRRAPSSSGTWTLREPQEPTGGKTFWKGKVGFGCGIQHHPKTTITTEDTGSFRKRLDLKKIKIKTASQVFSQIWELSRDQEKTQALLGIMVKKSQQMCSRNWFLISCSLKTFKLHPGHLFLIIAAHSNK